MRRFNFKDRKILSLILCIVLVSVFSLTIAYATLNAVLNISGNAEVVASSWNIHLDNVTVVSGSVSGVAPTISSNTVSFSTVLNMPGDFYEFTVDVVNNGTIDAMIDGITKSPTLTETQAKYLNYTVEYQNGESINTKQLVSEKSFVRLKVRVEYRSDLSASNLPTSADTLNLAFTVNYVQSDGSGSSVTNNGVRVISFTINGISYQALEGQRWYDWVASSYNTSGFFINDFDEVTFLDGCQTVEINGMSAVDNDLIYEGYEYSNQPTPC